MQTATESLLPSTAQLPLPLPPPSMHCTAQYCRIFVRQDRGVAASFSGWARGKVSLLIFISYYPAQLSHPQQPGSCTPADCGWLNCKTLGGILSENLRVEQQTMAICMKENFTMYANQGHRSLSTGTTITQLPVPSCRPMSHRIIRRCGQCGIHGSSPRSQAEESCDGTGSIGKGQAAS